MSSEFAVQCKGIKKVYHTNGIDTPALRGIDLEVKKSELLMLVGPSGCGKTTLISIIAGILLQDQGSCLVDGNNFAQMSERERTAARGKAIGFVFQSYNLIPTLSALENVAIPLLLANVRRKEALEKAKAILLQVGLEKSFYSRPAQLSGGQQQRVAIARALIHQPHLVVCDEPTSALDHENGMKIMQVFKEVALKNGKTLIVVTHDNRIFPFADRIATMDDGIIKEIE